MLRQRVLVVVVLLPIGLWATYLGGVPFLLLITLILGAAGWEYGRLFRAGGFRPASFLIAGGTLALLGGRYINGLNGNPFSSDSWILSLIVILAMSYHAIAFERGHSQAGTDFAITLGGVLYVGLLGSYLIPLRNLPDGLWWTLTTLPAVWLADSGAYFIGRRFGRRKFSPRLSPKKTWEGYFGGVIVGTIGTALLVLGWQALARTEIVMTPLRGGILGLVLAVVTPLGDLGESMLKRQVGVKDSSNLLPGHGGALDRIDTWLWAAAIGYYLIAWL
ncbi:MAG: phosphatidate cytidylyltransferase [Anaerolineales bacterium]